MVGQLREISETFALNKEASAYYQSLIQYVRAATTRDVMESMTEIEHTDSWLFQSQLRDEEKKLFDPDDIYFLVREREAERISQGLTPRIQFLDQAIAHLKTKSRPDPSG
jgi:uncharacterized circularly permuted ATP-grasp superfamily protein